MKRIVTVCALIALAACSEDQASNEATSQATQSPSASEGTFDPIIPANTEAPSGAYALDPTHASLTFRVNHLGFSYYTARFTKFDVQLQLDTGNPAASSVTADIDLNSLELNAPPPGFKDQLLGPQFFNVAQFPDMTFQSTKVDLTAPNAAHVTGDLTMHGETHPVSLDATFNGGYPGMELDPHARIGFSAHGILKRSDFGMGFGVPAPGTTMGVGDEVEIMIEAEFTGPPLANSTPAQPAP